ncbi:MAG TPA: DUF2795 domain-containing protein [Gaiellaceae bacterium]|nr:DUF2795 domain-containing protein [Gaiellaceae bacterium]
MPIWTFRGVESGVDLTGYEVEARDGSIGTVEEATTQAGQSYVVVDTGSWILGRRVLLPAGVIERIRLGEEKVFVNRSREEIKNAPEYGEPGATEQYRQQVGSYYGGLGQAAPASPPATRRTTSGRRLKKTTRRRTSAQAGSSRSRTRAQSRSRSRSSDGPTRDELYEQAKRLGIDGRSKMNKAQLSRAVGRKRGSSQSRKSTSARGRGSSTSARRKANPVEVQRFLDGVSYPTRKGDLLREAERKGASQKVRSTLERLPDERFKDPTQVSEAVGKLRR